MWYRTDWDASKLHPKCSGLLWVNPVTGNLAYFNTNTGKYTIAATLPTLTASGAWGGTLSISSRLWRSNFYASDSNSTYFLQAITGGWAISKYLGGGMGSTDQWWKCTSGMIGTFAHQGAATSDITVAWTSNFGQAESTAQAGAYTGSFTAYFGMRQLSCGMMGTLAETTTYVNGKPTFTATGTLGTWIIQYNSAGGYWTLSLGGDVTGLKYPYWKTSGSTLTGTYSQVWNGTTADYNALYAIFKQASVTVAISYWYATSALVSGWMCEVSHFLNGSR